MNPEHAFVKNAADEGQVREAEQKQSNKRKTEIADLRAILGTQAGRRFIWRLLGKCKVNGSIWEPNERIYYNSGQQDIGHFIMSEVVTAGEDFYLQMMTENRGEKNG